MRQQFCPCPLLFHLFVSVFLCLLLVSLVDGKRGHPKAHGEHNTSTRILIQLNKHYTTTEAQAEIPREGTAASSFTDTHKHLTQTLLTGSRQKERKGGGVSRQWMIDAEQISAISSVQTTNARHSGREEQALAVSLTDSFHVMYTASLSIGSPPQDFSVILDTGSSCLWVMSADTDKKAHKRYLHYYSHSQSHSYSPDNRLWAIQYGVGTCTGYLSCDTVTLDSLVVTNQTFAEATQLSSNFLNPNQPLDGILGLSFAGGACGEFNTFLDNLQEQLQIEKRLFSFHLDNTEIQEEEEEQQRDRRDNTKRRSTRNEVIFGQPDHSLYVDKLVYAPVLHAPHRAPAMWFVHLEQLSIVMSNDMDRNAASGKNTKHTDSNNKHLRQLAEQLASAGQDIVDLDPQSVDLSLSTDDLSTAQVLSFCQPTTIPCIALPDTGTSFLTLPTRLFIVLISILTHNRDDCLIDTMSNVFCLDAPHVNPLPSLAFTFNGASFFLHANHYVLPNKQLAIQVLDFGLNEVNIIILGDVFLRNVYTVFDAEEWRVGFGTARSGSSSVNDSERNIRLRQVLEDDQQRRNQRSRQGEHAASVWMGLLVLASCLFFCWLLLSWYGQWKRRQDYTAVNSFPEVSATIVN